MCAKKKPPHWIKLRKRWLMCWRRCLLNLSWLLQHDQKQVQDPDQTKAGSVCVTQWGSVELSGNWIHLHHQIKSSSENTGEVSLLSESVPLPPPSSGFLSSSHVKGVFVSALWYTLWVFPGQLFRTVTKLTEVTIALMETLRFEMSGIHIQSAVSIPTRTENFNSIGPGILPYFLKVPKSYPFRQIIENTCNTTTHYQSWIIAC